MTQSWNKLSEQEEWTLDTDELELLPGRNDKGRLGFAIQFKFRQVHGRYPDRFDEIFPTVVQWIADQVGVSSTTLSAYELDSRQGQRHRQIIRRYLGYQLPNGNDLKRLAAWLSEDVLPFDPQARHGRDLALDWCSTQRLEPPAGDHLDRIIRSAVRSYETQQLATIQARLNAQHQTAIDRLLASDDADTDETRVDAPSLITFSQLKTDPGKANLGSLLIAITKLGF